MTFLLDTNIVSFAIKQDSRIQQYAHLLAGSPQAISFMSVAELYQWAAIYQWGDKRLGALTQTLQNYAILPWALEMCPLWGKIRAEVRQKGQVISAEDAWVAATALYYQIPLVTHNPKDFTAVPDLYLITFA